MKKICIIAAILLVAGIALCLLGATMDGFRGEELVKSKLTDKTIEIHEDFSNIQIDTDTTDVVFSLSEDGSCRILCRETAQQFHTAEVKEGMLSLKQQDARKWYHHIGFHFETPSVEIQLSKAAFEDLTINGSTGDVKIPGDLSFVNAQIHASTGMVDVYAQVEKNLTVAVNTGNVFVFGIRCENMDLKASTGTIRVRDINCANLTTKTSTGDQRWENVQATGAVSVTCSTGDLYMTHVNCQNLSAESDTGKKTLEYVVANGDVWLEASTGDIHLVNFDGGTIKITTDTGDVTGTILSEKIFFTETDTGRVEVPCCTSGGSCEITTDTGDIILQLAQ